MIETVSQTYDISLTDESQQQIEQSPYTTAANTTYSVKNKATDLSSWLFISIDTNGKVLINSISKTMKIYMASKHTLCEQKKGESKYQQLSCRFSSALHPQQKINDLVTLVAIGN